MVGCRLIGGMVGGVYVKEVDREGESGLSGGRVCV